MRILVISDVHANLAALNAVLADAGSFDTIWSLGDIVGYGPDPNECIARLSEYQHVAIAGNHDWAVLGKLDLEDFNDSAREANLWTREQLTPISWSYLQALPEMSVIGDFTLAHGSPRHPIWEYLLSLELIKLNFAYYQTTVCLVGHTHIPMIVRDAPERSQQIVQPREKPPFRLDGQRYIINPGGVGQPRDRDPRAAYVIINTEEQIIEHHRVSYDIKSTQKKMRAARLPYKLILRLEYGL